MARKSKEEIKIDESVVVKEEKKINWKDVLVRSIKTFIQSTVSYFIMSINGLNFFGETTVTDRILHGFILGAISAGVCGVWNSVLSPLLDIDGTPTVKVVYVNKPVEVKVPSDTDEYDGADNG